MAEERREPTEEEMRAALEEQMRQIRVEDVILQTVATLVNLAGRRLGLAGAPEERDLAQAKLAIDGARALQPMCPEDQMDPIRQALSQLQMAYAREAKAGGAPPPEPSPGGPEAGPRTAESGPAPNEEDERAKARSKIWTPPGA